MLGWQSFIRKMMTRFSYLDVRNVKKCKTIWNEDQQGGAIVFQSMPL
jgi:hypothetical protein